MNKNILGYIGNTPLVKIKNPYGEDKANVYVKMEEFNPGGSVKTRIAIQMVIDAQAEGLLKLNSGQVIIEPTGGNTGIGLAIAGNLFGYKVILVIPDNYTKEKIDVLKSFGAEVLLSDHNTGNNSHILKVLEILKEHPEYVFLNQLGNSSNPKAHYNGTGTEIVNFFLENNSKIDIFTLGFGSAGTIMGAGKKIKEIFNDAKIFGIQPEGCQVLEKKFVPHKIQGWAVGVLSDFFDKTLIDKMFSVTFEKAKKTMDYLAKNESVFVGISSGANIATAFEISKEYDNTVNIVTVAPDSGRSYIDVYKDILNGI